jgi:hypothetical protein
MIRKKKKEKIKKIVVNGRKISHILEDFAHSTMSPTVTVGEFKKAISQRSYGLLMFFFALPCIIPIPTPGLSTVVGAPLLLLTFQLVLGLKTPWLPKFIADHKFKSAEMKKVCNYIVPYLKKLELVIKPRLGFLVEPPAERLIAILCFFMSIIIICPIPFGNAIPSMAICLFSLAILTHDGLLAIFGFIVTMISMVVLSAFVDVIAGFFG